jgi:branched-subunit amino acid transport protein
MAVEYTDVAIWGVILIIGLLTYAIRLSFVPLIGWIDEMPPVAEDALRYVPAAVLAALVVPSVVTVDPGTGSLAVDKLLAGGVAAIVAWQTEDLLATMGVGMAVLWVVRFLL